MAPQAIPSSRINGTRLAKTSQRQVMLHSLRCAFSQVEHKWVLVNFLFFGGGRKLKCWMLTKMEDMFCRVAHYPRKTTPWVEILQQAQRSTWIGVCVPLPDHAFFTLQWIEVLGLDRTSAWGHLVCIGYFSNCQTKQPAAFTGQLYQPKQGAILWTEHCMWTTQHSTVVLGSTFINSAAYMFCCEPIPDGSVAGVLYQDSFNHRHMPLHMS